MMMVIIKNNQCPDGKELPPDRRKYDEPPKCTTRQMTEEEREKYGPPNPVKRPLVFNFDPTLGEKNLTLAKPKKIKQARSNTKTK